MSVLPSRQVHLDFHTSEKIDNIGSKFDKKQFQDCLKKGHINSITVFAKCHHGMMYYPSKTGTMHPGLHGFDLLSAELEACCEIGVHAPIYISAGFDVDYLTKHPECRAIPKPEETYVKYPPMDGFKLICYNSPYLDVLVSQIEEVVQKFNPEGVFLDISSPKVCYCRYCRKIIEQRGLDQSDPQNFVDLSIETFKKYADRTNAAVKSVNKNTRVFHNGGNISARRPEEAFYNTHLELESLPTGGWGYDHFPRSARYAATLGLEYLGMTGKFHTTWGEFGGFKHLNALIYEVALSMSFGAKCSIGDQMHPYGFMDEATYSLIGKAYEYGEKIEEYCLDSVQMYDIGVLLSESYAIEPPKSRLNNHDVGICRVLNEGNYLYSLLDKNASFDGFKVLVLPDDIRITPELKEKLDKYLKNGGKLLCTGKSGLSTEKDEFLFDFGAEYAGESEYNPTYIRPEFSPFGLPSSSFVIYAKSYVIEKTPECTEVFAHARDPFFNRTPEHFCSHRHAPFVDYDRGPGITFGKDGAYIAWDMAEEYAVTGCMIAKETIIQTLEKLIGNDKTISVNLPSAGFLTLNKQAEKSRYVANLVYASPIKRGNGVEVIEELVPLNNIVISVKLPEKVKRVYRGTDRSKLAFTQNDGTVNVKLDKFTCHESVVFEIL